MEIGPSWTSGKAGDALPSNRGLIGLTRFRHQIARRLRNLRPFASSCWPRDKVIRSIGVKRMFLWRAVDDGGEVLEAVV